MLMVIFGAGASYDSTNLRKPGSGDNWANERLPLARDLFHDRYRSIMSRHSAIQGLVTRLQKAAANYALEQELERLRDEEGRYPYLSPQLLELRYYLHSLIAETTNHWYGRLIHGVTNYSELLQRVEPWRHDHDEQVCLVTFNYDTMLESAVAGVLGLSFGEVDEYIADTHYKVFKVHGSVNWWRQVTNVEGTARKSANQLKWTNIYAHHRASPPPGAEWVPAISIPTVSKSGFECTDETISLLSQLMPHVTRLLIIGWRGMEQHFLNLWQKEISPVTGEPFPPGLRRLQIVTTSEDSAGKVKEQLALGGGIQCADTRLVGGGFTDYLTHEDAPLEDFLSD